jgi:hypothetical protein
MTGTENQDPEYVTMEDLETEIENYLLLAMPQIFVEECKGDFLKFICGKSSCYTRYTPFSHECRQYFFECRAGIQTML